MPPDSPDTAASNIADLDQGHWNRLTRSETAAEFCESWLGIQTKIIGQTAAGLVVLGDDKGGWMPMAAWPRGTGEAAELGRVAERVISERKGLVQPVDQKEGDDAPSGAWLHLAYPVQVNQNMRGVAILRLAARPQGQVKVAMRQLQWGVAWIQNWILRSATAESAGPQRLAAALEMVAIALQEETFQSAATSLVTELATRLQCDRVSVGFMERRQPKVKALSHSAQFGKHMNLIRDIGGAMGESIDQHETLNYPETDADGANVLKAHEQLARAHGDGAILTVPFVDPQGHGFGALTLERAAIEPFTPDAVALCEAVASLVGPILEDKRLNDRFLIRKAWDSLWEQVKKLFGPRHTVRKLVAIGLVVVVLFFTFATGTFRVTAETALEGEIQRVVAVPFRGFIKEAPVRSGDLVEEGQLMATLDDRDLQVEYSRVSSEREQYVLEHRRAMSEGDAASMNVLTKRMQQAEAQLTLLDEQLTRTRIIAPFDGIVVSGDLSQSLGAPVDVGQVLFEVAPLDAYRLILKVQEDDINFVEPGQTGDLVLTAVPNTKLSFRVVKITPVSFPEEGNNYFNVEAELVGSSARLRPGMEGYGKIEIDQRKLIWIWPRRFVTWLRLWLWSWTP
jgi:hypothetical protein